MNEGNYKVSLMVGMEDREMVVVVAPASLPNEQVCERAGGGWVGAQRHCSSKEEALSVVDGSDGNGGLVYDRLEVIE